MRVALLGAAGIVGRALARLLVAVDDCDLRLLDRDAPGVQALARETGAEAAPVDVTDPDGTARALRGSELALNATWYYHNVSVMRAALLAETDYLDLGGLYHTTLRQLEWNGRFRDAGRRALLGCGKAPGITNVLARRGAFEFDRIARVRLRSGRRSPPDDGRSVRLPYSPQTLLDELALPPVVLRHGRLEKRPPLADRETVRHPEPWGEIEYITTLHSELATLPNSLGPSVGDMDFMVALPHATVETLGALVRLGFASRDPIPGWSTSVIPRDVALALLARLPTAPAGPEPWLVEVELEGTVRGRSGRTVLRVSGDERQNGTAVGAAAAVRLLSKGRAGEPGVLPPEAAFAPDEYLRELERYGLAFDATGPLTLEAPAGG